MGKPGDSCVEPAAGPLDVPDDTGGAPDDASPRKEKPAMAVTVGKAAPDFQANAYHEGGFKQIKLSDYLGQWVVLCFYPGDFTFV